MSLSETLPMAHVETTVANTDAKVEHLIVDLVKAVTSLPVRSVVEMLP